MALDRADVRMSERRYRQYLAWLGTSWELNDVAQIEFAYYALRRDAR